MASNLLSVLGTPPYWPSSVLVLAATICVLLFRLVSRPAWPPKAPKYLPGWPVIGSPGFFGDRWSFLKEGYSRSPLGQFSFFYGPHPIVALSGSAGRQTFYNSRSLDMNEGFLALFSGAPNIEHLYKGKGTLPEHLLTLFRRFLHKDRLAANLHDMVGDCLSSFQEIDATEPMDPFDGIYLLIYRLTMRQFGTVDVANDPKLLRDTLRTFGALDDSSWLAIMFPRLPVPGRLRKIWAGAKLHRLFAGIIRERRRTGTRRDDAMQVMMDAGESDVIISAFIMGGVFAGLLNTGIMAAWLFLYLAEKEEWCRKIRDEVAAVVARHRLSDQESGADILACLTMEQWEGEFPLVDYCLRETIRLALPGSALRKNVGKDIDIAGSGEVIPKDTFVVYPLADAHLDPELYSDPQTWDPSRFFPDRAEDKKESHAFVGWGGGFHPCLGMRFAKIEINMCVAFFVTFFDFKLVDKLGREEGAKLPQLPVGHFAPIMQRGEAFLRCERRV